MVKKSKMKNFAFTFDKFLYFESKRFDFSFKEFFEKVEGEEEKRWIDRGFDINYRTILANRLTLMYI